jgi:hypothetical protein
MTNEKLEDKEIESISKWTKIPIEVVREYRKISRDEAISRFLTEESKDKIISYGYTSEPRSREEKLRSALSGLHFGEFKEDFYRTEEGRLWFDCNVPNILRVSAEVFESVKQCRKKYPNQGRQISWRKALDIVARYR